MGNGFTFSLKINNNEYASNNKFRVSGHSIDMKPNPQTSAFPTGVRLYSIMFPVSVVVLDGIMEDFSNFVALSGDIESIGARSTSNNTVTITRDGVYYTRQILVGSTVTQWSKNKNPKTMTVTINLLVERGV